MHRNRAHRVVHMQLMVQQPDAENHQHAGDSADHDGAESVRHITSGGDGHQAGQRGIQAHRNIGLAVLDPGNDHAHDRGHRGSDRGGQENGAQLGHRGSGSAIEAIPAQPQDKHAQRADGQVMSGERVDLDDLALLVFHKLADAGPEHPRADERAQAADHMDARRTRKVMETDLRKPAATPDPVSLNGVDQRGDDCGINTV